MTTRYACARFARDVGEPIFGTASPVRRWLLVEQDGAWGRDAVVESRIDRATGLALKARAAELGARPVLIRRHGGGRARRRHAVIAAVTEETGGFAEEFHVETVADVLDLDLTGLGSGEPSGGERLEEPLFLVCTNGRHDACCAEFGRPLARALSALHPASTWECSHIGGDRFAANVVCLPEGVYYGRVGVLDAPEVAAAHRRGQVVLDHFRGRSCHPFVVQAAEYFVRRDHGVAGVTDLALDHWDQLDANAHRVELRGPAGRLVVDLTVTPDSDPRPLTCTASHPQHPPRYLLRSIEAV